MGSEGCVLIFILRGPRRLLIVWFGHLFRYNGVWVMAGARAVAIIVGERGGGGGGLNGC